MFKNVQIIHATPKHQLRQATQAIQKSRNQGYQSSHVLSFQAFCQPLPNFKVLKVINHLAGIKI